MATSNGTTAPVGFETPRQLLGRLKLGREEFCQRLLTALILDGPYPRWNTRSKPCDAGVRFLQALYQRSFGSPWPEGDLSFIDEFELPPRHDAEKGGAPDYAVLWRDCAWLIELKTEKASHRSGQIPGYFELAHHHYPNADIDLLYVTPPMDAPYDPGDPRARYAHTTWDQVADSIRLAWPSGRSPDQQEVIDGLLYVITHLGTPASAWRPDFLAAFEVALPTFTAKRAQPAPTTDAKSSPGRSPIDVALDAAKLTADDGRQRAVDLVVTDLEDLLNLRLSVRDSLASSPEGSPLRYVRPWVWRPESTGQPITEFGQEHGMELRLSRYRSRQYQSAGRP